jgi:hypothetical protein
VPPHTTQKNWWSSIAQALPHRGSVPLERLTPPSFGTLSPAMSPVTPTLEVVVQDLCSIRGAGRCRDEQVPCH